MNRYPNSPQPVATPDVRTGLFEDVYVTLAGGGAERGADLGGGVPADVAAVGGRAGGGGRRSLVAHRSPSRRSHAARAGRSSRAAERWLRRGGGPAGRVAAVAAVVIVVGLLPGNAPPASATPNGPVPSPPTCAAPSARASRSPMPRPRWPGTCRRSSPRRSPTGWSDDEIYDYFVARYTERVRLDSRFEGWGAALWLTPLALAGVGAAAILNRRRRPAGDAAPAEPCRRAGRRGGRRLT